MPLKWVQELLGRASIEMTMRCARLSPATNHDAVERWTPQVVTQAVTPQLNHENRQLGPPAADEKRKRAGIERGRFVVLR